jgi:hypothetical protein
MFAGATMEDVENDYDTDDTDEENGPFRGVKRRIKDTFHRTQEEARDMFEGSSTRLPISSTEGRNTK